MNSPMEDRLRAALTEAGATVDTQTLRPLRAPERRRFRVDVRMVAVAAVVLAGATTAVGLGVGQGGDENRAVATGATPGSVMELAVFLCTKSDKDSPCHGLAATLDQTKSVETAAKQLPDAESIVFVNQTEAYENFRQDFADNAVVLDAVKVEDMSPSFLVKIKYGADVRSALQALGAIVGVAAVEERPVADTRVNAATKADISVFLCHDASPVPTCGAGLAADGEDAQKVVKEGKGVTKGQKKAISELIRSMPEVKSFLFEDQKTAYANFRSAYAGNETLVNATKVTDMPESYRLMMKPKSSDWSDVIATLKRQPGVSSVVKFPCTAIGERLRAYYRLTLPESKVCPAGA